MKKDKGMDRRGFLKMGVKAGGGMLVLSAIPVQLLANDKLSEDDPLAVAFGYKLDATTVDTEKFPKRAGESGATQFCDNCALYTSESSAEFGPCSIFQNKLVAAKGWCNAWVAKT